MPAASRSLHPLRMQELRGLLLALVAEGRELVPGTGTGGSHCWRELIIKYPTDQLRAESLGLSAVPRPDAPSLIEHRGEQEAGTEKSLVGAVR